MQIQATNIYRVNHSKHWNLIFKLIITYTKAQKSKKLKCIVYKYVYYFRIVI